MIRAALLFALAGSCYAIVVDASSLGVIGAALSLGGLLFVTYR